MSETECPECESYLVRDTGMGCGQITSTYAKFTRRYECQSCGKWFSVTTEYDKTQANERSKRALRQVEEGEMNSYDSVEELTRRVCHD